jgi:hypothetical protein
MAEHEARHAATAGLLGRPVHGIALYADGDGCTRTDFHGDVADAIISLIPGASPVDVAAGEAICARLGINPAVPRFLAAALLLHYGEFVAMLAEEIDRAAHLEGDEVAEAWNRALAGLGATERLSAAVP